MTMAVAGRTAARWYRAPGTGPPVRNHAEMMRPPLSGGLIYMKESSVTVGRAGRLSVHTLDERAHGMRETEVPPSCMLRDYRSLSVVT
jgi:hypothetical protein